MAFSGKYDGTDIDHFDIPRFQFTNGTTLPIRLAYRSHNPNSSKKALIPTCYGGLINGTLAFNAPHQALASYHVVVVAMLGNGESSSPSNTLGFPSILDYRDVVNAQYKLLTERLGMKSLDAVIGFSMGGQQAYYWACMYPSFVRNAVAICSSARTSGHNYSFLEGPKAALQNSADYARFKSNTDAGKEKALPIDGLKAFGRAYGAWLTSGGWFRRRAWEKMGLESIDDFMTGVCEASFTGWNPEDLLILANMWQHADVGVTVGSESVKPTMEGNGNLRHMNEDDEASYNEALKEQIQARMLIMPCRTDQYFAWEDSEIEVKLMGEKAQLAVIESDWGHMAGGGGSPEDTEWMSQEIKKFLAEDEGLKSLLKTQIDSAHPIRVR